MQDNSRPSARRSRTSKACDRCRRQKLKCDTTRPCVLCTRAGIKCETSLNTPIRRRGRRDPHTPGTNNINVQRDDSPAQEQNRLSPADGSGRTVTLSYLASASDTPSEAQNFNAGTSAIDFARHVFNEEETGRTLTGASIPGDTGISESGHVLWSLKEIAMPPPSVMLSLIDAYFDRMQWFILLFHEGSFREMSQKIISQTQWRREDLGTVMVVLSVAAIALQSTLPDQNWPGHEILSFHGIHASDLLHGLIAEIRLHLLDILEDCQIEGIQVCFLLSSYYVFHNSPNLAWTVGGMALRAAAALDIQNPAPKSKGQVKNEVRSRCWNHLIIADTFSSMVYGRPTSTDPASVVHPLRDLDDLLVDPWLLSHPLIGESGGAAARTMFHVMRAEIYGVIRDTLCRFRQLRLQPHMQEKDLEAIVQIAQNADSLLCQLQARIPPLFNLEYWRQDNRWDKIERELPEMPRRTRNQLDIIYLQAATLQLTYDTAVIQIHRPLLERKLDGSVYHRPVMDAVYQSLEAATAAALRISHIPVHRFRNHFAASFASMQQFTAGVILCIPPTSHPFTPTAHEAKEGVMRIIHASRSLSHYNRIAKQSEELLTELLKVTISREMSRALGKDDGPGNDKSLSSAGRPTTTSRDTRNFLDSNSPECRRIPNQPSSNLIDGRVQLQGSSDPIASSWTAPPDGIGRGLDLWDFPSTHIFHQLDNTFGAFGESFFNLVFDDQNSAWNWGRTFP